MYIIIDMLWDGVLLKSSAGPILLQGERFMCVNERIKKVLSFLLSMILVLQYVPAPAFAEETPETGLCEHHAVHENCGYVAAVAGADCTHEHDDSCFTTKCAHVHGDCGYVAAVEDEEPKEEILCGHSCAGEEACNEKVLNCAHVHSESCGYVEGKACEFVCETCAAEEAAAAAVAEVKALIDVLPSVDAVQAMPMEEQKTAYEQTQSAYEAYGQLTEEQQKELTDPEEVFKPLFEYFNTLIDADGEVGSGTPDGTAPVLNGLTISATAVTTPGKIEVVVDAADSISGVAGGHVVFECLETEHTLNCSLFNSYYDENAGTDIPYTDGKLHGSIIVGQYNLSGTYKIRVIGLEDKAGNRINMYSRTYSDGVFEPYIPEQYESLQFKVEESTTPDDTAPTLNNLTISTTNVTAPENIEVIVEASDLVSGVTGGHVVFECLETEHTLNCSLSNYYYDEETGTDIPYTDGKLHGTIKIDQYNLSGIYKIRAIGLEDKAGNRVNMYSRTYNDGFFKPYIPEQYEFLQFTVQESATPDNTAPTLNSLTISATNVTAPGNIEVIVEASDLVSGVDGGHIVFECSDTRRELNCSLFDTYYDEEAGTDVPYTDGKLHGTIIIDQYNLSGTYKIRAIGLVDNAGNGVNMFSRTYNNGFFEPYIPEQYESLQFTVTNVGADITTSTNQSAFVEDVTNAANDAYIVADFSSNSKLPQGAFDGIKESNKTLELTSEGVTWQFKGTDITEDTKDIDLSVQITKAEESTSVDGEAIQDKLNGTNGVVMKFAENGQLPGKATIQIKVDYAMREYLGSSTGLNVYYYNNQTGELELVAQNLTVINDTYVEFSITHCSYYVLTTAETDADEIASGCCGENLTWIFDETTGTLTISGTGAMDDYRSVHSNGVMKEVAPWYYYEVKKAVILDGVTYIGRCAFLSQTQMNSVEIPESVTSIGIGAFCGCSNLTDVTLPESITNIGVWSFLSCEKLSKINIPDNITIINDSLFAHCSSLSKVTIPAGVTRLGDNAFLFSGLTSIVIPEKVTSIGGSAFDGCNKLTKIIFTGNAPQFITSEPHATATDSAFYGVTATAYYPVGNSTWTESVMQNYGGNITWKPYCPDKHTEVVDRAVEASCTATGLTEGKHCSACGEVLTAQTTVAAKGHNYVNGYCSRCGTAAPTSGGNAGNDGSTNTGTGSTGTTVRPTTQPNQNGVELSAKELEASANRNATTTIAVDGVRITFDAKAQEAIADQSAKDDIYLHYEEIREAKLNKDQKKAIKDHLSDHKGQKHVLTFSIMLISGGKEIHDFKGGTATVKIPFTPDPGTTGDEYRVFFVDTSGDIQPMETSYENGNLIVVLPHFSDYVVFYMPEESSDVETEDAEPVPANESSERGIPSSASAVPTMPATSHTNNQWLLYVGAGCMIMAVGLLVYLLCFLRKEKRNQR